MECTIKPHAVEVQRITKLAPLVSDSQHLMAPEFGLLLVLEDGSRAKWLTEPNTSAPQGGDFFVKDEAVHATYLVPAAKFAELFGCTRTVSKEEHRATQERLLEISNEMLQVGYGTTEYDRLEKERHELIAKGAR